MKHGWRKVGFLVLAATPYAFALLTQPKQALATSNEVLGLFKAHCISCHTGKESAAGLDLSTINGILKGGVSGKSVVAGKPDKSNLLDRILGKHGMPRMPMGFAPLSAADTAKVRSWIAGGAIVASGGPKKHWAYVAPVRPAVPAVKNPTWIKNPIDAFVLSRLEKGQLSPSKPAAKETLIRRVYLDLIGIPPTPEEVDKFVADKSPDAYEKLVDKLLANPHYGERMARPWLDLARYADSDGYEKDLNRTAWLYRDYVIDAFNANKPYDQFTIEQLAGDLLPNATADQKIATGFNRNTMFNREGGVDQAEAYFNVILDRVGTTSTVWLGSTLQCARCHDHKYDPFSQKDFYKMYAYFGNGVVIPKGPKDVSEEKWFEPELPVPTKDQQVKLKSWNTELTAAEAHLKALSTSLSTERTAWEKAAKTHQWIPAKPTSFVAQSGLKPTIADDGTVFLQHKTSQDVYTLEFDLPMGAVYGFRIEAVPDQRLSNNGVGNADGGNFILSKVTSKVGDNSVDFQAQSADFVQDGYGLNGLFDENPNTGWALAPTANQPHELALNWKYPVLSDAPTKAILKFEMNSNQWPTHTMGSFRVSFSKTPNPDQFVMSKPIRDALRASTRSAEQEMVLAKFYETVSPTLRATRDQIAELKGKIASIQGQVPTALVLQDKPATGPLMASVYHRGEFMSPGDKVKAGVPDVLPPLEKGSQSNRLGLAKWISSKSNPLTARVQVNRLWDQCFGRGLVETSEDFGTQGSRPSHPELLDWLATEFMQSGWDVKHMMRLIVTSNTYRQTSVVTPTMLNRDPVNILLSRGPRFRLEAEMIRDVTLAASGQLSKQIGGPSVYPFQPEGVWNTPYSGEQWMQSPGKDKYRRGVYTFLKRTAPYPSFMAFDATSREACTVRRIRTNTPLQALAMLNDKAVLESAAALAERMITASKDDKSRITYGFRLCTSRKPTATETEILAKSLNRLRSQYQVSPEEAKKLANSSEKAAWVMIANVLLNLDETITKE